MGKEGKIVEFIDLKAQYRYLQKTIDANILNILADAKFIGGPQVSEFESKLAGYVGRKYCISCGNGTEALQLAYMAYGIGKGDAVFCPDMTFIASVEPACLLGASPVFCDIEPDTYNLSPYSLEEHIQQVIREGRLKPRMAVAVDFLGNPARYNEISAICKKYGLVLIEDGAQSMSASYEGGKCGIFGDIAVTSFFPSKPLGCYGDGGAVFTDDDEIAQLITSYKVHGKGPKGKYDNVRIGINSRLDTLQAGVLLAKLEALEEELGKRQEAAARYDKAFRGKVQIPVVTENAVSSYAQYCILATDIVQRERILGHLKEKNIPSNIYYPSQLHSLKAFFPYEDEDIPNARKYAQCNIGLPFSPYLTREDQEQVIKAVLEVL